MNEKSIVKAVKELAKSERVLTQRVGERVYLCNGYWACYLPLAYYNMLVRPVSARFPDLPDNQGSRHELNSYEPLPTVNSNCMKLDDLFEQRRSAMGKYEVDDTGFKKIMDKKGCANVLLCEGEMIFVDEKIASSARAFCDNDDRHEFTDGKSHRNAPVYRLGNNFGYLMLPIRYDHEPYIIKAS